VEPERGFLFALVGAIDGMTRKRGERRTVSRRGALRTGTLAVGGVAVAGAAGSAAARTTVTGGGGALQTAIDGADEGDTVVVGDDATYDPVTIDVDELTVRTDDGATVAGDGGDGAAVSVDADGVTVSGFSVTNPGGLLGIKVEAGYDDATIENNTVEDVGPTGRLGVTGVVVGQGDHDGIEIANNEIRGLVQETTGAFASANGVLFDADNDDPMTISDSSVVNNTIEGIESDGAPQGVVVQHRTDGVSIVNNDIADLTAESNDDDDFGYAFAQGISIDSTDTDDTTVARNEITDVRSDDITPEAVKIDGDGGGVRFRANVFGVAIGLNNRNGADGVSEIDARNNYWGSPEGPEEAASNADADDDDRADVIGRVEYEPFLRSSPGGNGNGSGSGNGNGNGN